jgi:membrane-bound lytic murein transglycosylase B
VALLVAVFVVAAAGAAAAAPSHLRTVEPVAVIPPGAGAIMPGIDARLLGVPLIADPGPDASADLAAAQTQLATLQASQRTLTAQKHELDERTLTLTAVEQRSEAALRRTQALVDRVAAAAYKGATDGLLAVLPSENVLDMSRRMKLAGQAGTSLRAIARQAAAARRSASRDGEHAAKESVNVRQQLDALAAQIPVAQRTVDARLAQAANDLPARKVAGLGIPVAALDAYLRAERTVAVLLPACGIQWWVLAGIADGESGHGTHGGARADVHGDVFPPIIGIPLDGTNSTQPVADTDKGLLDGDPIWDHAVGALQFTPGTWNRWASDGNGDGKTDPQNLYDASLAAARKLCTDAGPSGMHTDAQIAAALKPYTVTNALVKAKLARAKAYEAQGLPTPPG